MKNMIKLKAILRIAGIIALTAVIGVAMTSYAGTAGARSGGGRGTLTITGLDAYNGKFIKAEVWLEDGRWLVAALDFTGRTHPFEPNLITGGIIENGLVVLPVWDITVSYPEGWNEDEDAGPPSYTITRYAGSRILEFHVEISDDQRNFHWHFRAGQGTASATFNRGRAEAVFVEEKYE